MNTIIIAVLAGVIYSLTGWAKNAEEPDARKRNFNWAKFTKNIILGLILGFIAGFFPELELSQISALPLFTVIQMFVDKLITKKLLG